MRRCEDEKMACADVKMRRCEDEKMIARPPLLEEVFAQAQTLSGKMGFGTFGTQADDMRAFFWCVKKVQLADDMRILFFSDVSLHSCHLSKSIDWRHD